jgi:hypothetical protein
MSRNLQHINSDNYEVFFMDYLDGKLSDDQKSELMGFLSCNPELQRELEMAGDMKIEPLENISYSGKISLFRAPEPFTAISETDYLLIKEAEEGLTENETMRLNRFLSISPTLYQDRELIKKTFLKPGNLIYASQQSLHRHTFTTWLWPVLKGAAAAILIFALFNYKDSTILPQHDQMAVSETVESAEVVPDLIIPETSSNYQRNSDPQSVNTHYKLPQTRPTLKAHHTDMQTQKDFIRETVEFLPAPSVAMVPQYRRPNSYEIGLSLMMPKYIENHQILATVDLPPLTPGPIEQSLLGRTTDLISRVTPLSLSFNKVYDDEGDLVAFNLKAENFELAQRIPRWMTTQR